MIEEWGLLHTLASFLNNIKKDDPPGFGEQEMKIFEFMNIGVEWIIIFEVVIVWFFWDSFGVELY